MSKENNYETPCIMEIELLSEQGWTTVMNLFSY